MRKHFLILMLLSLLPFAAWAHNAGWTGGNAPDLTYDGTTLDVSSLATYLTVTSSAGSNTCTYYQHNASAPTGNNNRYNLAVYDTYAAANSGSGSETTIKDAKTYYVRVSVRGQSTTGWSPSYSSTYHVLEFTIAQKEVDVTFYSYNKTYGDADFTSANLPGSAYKATPSEAWDDIKGFIELSRLDFGENVGTYGYQATQNTATGSDNYLLHFSYGGSGAKINIDQAPLDVIISTDGDDNKKTYGDADPASFVIKAKTPSQFKYSDDISVVTADLTRAVGENVGDYAITGTATATNYNVNLTTPGTFTINKKAATVSVVADQQKTYGEDNPAKYLVESSDLVVNDALGIDDNVDNVGLTVTREAGENVQVGGYAITITGGNDNYLWTRNPGVFTINKKDATVSVVADQQKTYGENNPLKYLVESSDLVNNPGLGIADNVDNVGLIVTREVGENVQDGGYDITISGGNGNYNWDFINGVFTINKKAATVSVVAGQTKVYGQDNPAKYLVESSDLVNNPGLSIADDVDNVGLTVTRAEGEHVANSPYAITIADGNGNYEWAFVPGEFTITPKAATVTAVDKSKTYGADDPTLTATSSDLVNNPSIGIADDVDNVGLVITRAAGEQVANSPYAITITSANADYDFAFVPGDFTINPYALTLKAVDKSKVYGQPDPLFETEVVAGEYQFTDDFAAVGGSFIREKLGLDEGELVGHYFIQPVATSTNYDFTFQNGDLEITKATATLTAEDKSKTYGEADPEFTVVAEGLTNGDDLTTIGAGATRAAGEDAAEYAISPKGNAHFEDNYTFTYVDGTMTINPKAITVTAEDKNKTYGDADPEFTAVADGLEFTDQVADLGLTITRAEGETVANYAITPSAGTNTNYTYTYVPGELTITKRNATLIAVASEKTYGDNDPEFEATCDDLQFEDALDNIGLSFTRVPGETVATYAVTPSASNGNYNFTGIPANLTINKRNATLTADDKSKTYGAADPELTAQAENLANNAAIGVVDDLTNIGFSIERAAGEDVAEYAITPAATSTNYEWTFVDGTLTIGKKAATLTAENKSKVYGNADPTFTAVAEGLENGDNLTNIGLSFTREEGEHFGTYAITPAATSENYDWTFVDGELSIEKRGLVYAMSNKEVEYNGKAVTTEGVYTLSSGSFADGESLAGLGISFDFFDEIKNAGTYTADKLNVNYNENIDYDINFTGAATIKVNQKQFTEEMITNFETPKTYTGSALDPNITVEDKPSTEEESIIAWPRDYTLTIAKAGAEIEDKDVVEAGLYTYTFTPTAEGNYKGEAITKNFAIGGMAISEAWFEEPWVAEVTYNGKAQPAEFTLSYVNDDEETVTLTKDADFTVDITVGEDAAAEVKNADVYTYTFKGIGNYSGQFEKTYTINKADLTLDDEHFVAPAAVEGLKYSAADLTLITAGSVTVDTEDTDVKVLYSLDNENFVEDLPTGYNAGNYPVYFMIDGGLNYNDVPAASVDATIAKRVVIVTAESVERVYDATTGLGALEPEVIYSGLQGEDKAEDVVEFTGASIFTGAAVTAKNVGVYNIGIDYEHMFATNYEFAEAETQGTMTINAADVILTLNDRDEDGNYLINKEYGMADNANQFKNFLEVEGAVASEVNTLKGYVTISRTNASEKNVGKYDDVLKINLLTTTAAKNFFKNYNVDATYVGDFEIVKRAVTMALKADLEKVYDGVVPTTTELAAEDLVVTSLVPGDDMSQFSVLPTATIVDATKNVGVYTITLDGAEAKNYEISYLDARYTITPRELTNFNVQTQVVRKGDDKDVINSALWQVTGIQGDDDKDAIFELVVDPSLYDEDYKINVAGGEHQDGLVLVVKEYENDEEATEKARIAAANYSGFEGVAGVLMVVDEEEPGVITFFDDQEEFDNIVAADGTTFDKVQVVINRDQAIGSYDGKWHADEWNTMVLPFDVTPKELSNAFGYAIVNLVDPSRTSKIGDKVNVAFKLNMTQTIPANTPFTIRTDEDIKLNSYVEFEKKTIVAPTSSQVSVPAGENEYEGFSFVGVYNTFTIDNTHPDYHFLVNGGWKHIGASSSNTYDIVPFNCYVDQSAASGVRPEDVTFTFEDENGNVTAIKTVNVDGEAMFAEGWYTLEGKKLNAAPAQKGVYIHNGKKTVIK